jgi:hypothetical protein
MEEKVAWVALFVVLHASYHYIAGTYELLQL